MIKVTQDLKDTIKKNPHIEEVHFDAKGNHFLSVHLNEQDGKLYHRIKDLSGSKTSTNKEGLTTTKRVRIYESDPEHEIIETISAREVLSTPISEIENSVTAEILEEIEKLKSENEKLKSSKSKGGTNAELEALKVEMAKLKEENETYQEMIAESQKAQTESPELEAKDTPEDLTK